MQPQLLKENSARMRFWRGVALALSTLAAGLSGYGALAQHQAVVVKTATPERASRAGHPAPSLPLSLSLPEPSVRMSSEEVTQLVATRDPAVLERLLVIAEQEQTGASSVAYEGIAHFGGDRALRFLSERLNSAPDSDLFEAANALTTMGGSQAHVVLQTATHSRRVAVRDAAFAALVSVDTPDVRDFMLAALNEPAPTSAISYFGDCRDPRALPALERLARSPLEELSRAALDALLAQGTRAEGAFTRLLQADAELTDALLATPPHTPGALRALRTATIARLREGALSGGPVFDFLERDLSAESREALLISARDPASADAACTALARRGDAASLAGLSQLANDSDPQLAARASCALATDPDSRSRVPLERAMRGNERSPAARALVHINAPGARAI
ncbi:MAG: hypothetical protein ABI488_19210 [Polyangiaceae bacterium]